jgi:hypothetical protein
VAAEVEVIITGKDNYSSVLGNFGSIITGIESAVHLAAEAFNAVLTPVINFGKEAILTAARVDELRVVNQILGETAGIPALYLEKIATSIRSMGIEAGIAETTIAAFITSDLDLAYATDIARIAQDAAVISGMNSSETLKNIVYGIETLNPLVLRHAGIVVDLQLSYQEWADEMDRDVQTLTTAEKQQIALNEVLEAGVDIAGAYAAAMEEPGKVLRSFPRYFDDIMVAIGEPFQDAFGSVIFAVADLAKEFVKAVSEGGTLRPVLDDIARIASIAGEAFAELVNILTTLLSGDIVKLYDLGAAMQSWKDISPIFYDLGTALRVFQQALDNGDTVWGALITTADRLGGSDSPLARVLEYIISIKEEFDSGGFTGVIGFVIESIPMEDIVAWTDELDVQLAEAIKAHDWIASGDAFGNTIVGLFSTSIKSKGSEAIPALGQAISDFFLGAMGVVSWEEAGTTFMGILKYIFIEYPNWDEIAIGFADMWSYLVMSTLETISKTGSEIGIGFMDMLTHVFVETVDFIVGTDSWRAIGIAIYQGWQSVLDLEWSWDADAWFKEHVIDPVKRALGISSPSSVFADIGRNVILGLMSGLLGMVGPLLSLISFIVDRLLAPFQPILDLFNIGGGTGGSSGTSDLGGGTGGTGGTGTVVNQYFAGATINVGSWDAIAYDCIYPNPFISATAGQLGGATGLSGGR